MQFLRFVKNRAGNVGMILALSAIPLVLAVGAAIDIMRQVDTNTLLQGAADAAVLAGVINKDTSDAAVTQTVANYLQTNGANRVLQNTIVTGHGFTTDQDHNFYVRVQGRIDTSFMGLAGIQTMDVGAYAESHIGSLPIEVSMVLDNTFSMSQTGNDGNTRLATLQVASKGIIDKLLSVKGPNSYVKVGIVPFAQYVNVGTNHRYDGWINVPADFTTTYTPDCYDTYPDAKADPNAGDQSCPMVPQPDTYNDGVVIHHPDRQQCSGGGVIWGEPVKYCPPTQTYNHTWYGCVGSRANGDDEIVAMNNDLYKGILDIACTRPLTDLTDLDSNGASALKNEIDLMQAVGETYIPAGLIWGWNLLDPNEPFTAAKPYDELQAKHGSKTLVLMTDGFNTIYPTYPDHLTTQDAGLIQASDERMLRICTNIKNAGIDLYVVALNVTDSSKTQNLQACASQESMFYNAQSNTELLAAFDEIARHLQEIALAK